MSPEVPVPRSVIAVVQCSLLVVESLVMISYNLQRRIAVSVTDQGVNLPIGLSILETVDSEDR